MKSFKSIIIALFSAMLLILCNSAEAQRSRIKSNKKAQERNIDDERQIERKNNQKLIDQLWFGGSVNLFWTNQRGFSQFLFGIAPMVGYKVTDKLSFGPRIEIQYTAFKIQTGPDNNNTFSNLNFGGFGFGRYKIFKKVFIHVESGITTQPILRTNAVGDPEFVRELRQPVFAGLGYSEGGTEIYLLYDFNDPDRNLRFPLDYRFGFNYNF
jgi:hypothetical protein